MSRYFLMSVEVRSPNPARVRDIETAAQIDWPFTEWTWSEAEKLLSSYAESSLSGGEGEEEFADRLTKAIWKANGEFCRVLVSATCLDDLPINLYELKKDDFVRWLKAETVRVDSGGSSGHAAKPRSEGES